MFRQMIPSTAISGRHIYAFLPTHTVRLWVRPSVITNPTASNLTKTPTPYSNRCLLPSMPKTAKPDESRMIEAYKVTRRSRKTQYY